MRTKMSATSHQAPPLHLRAGGVSLLMARTTPHGLPVVVHWGPDLGDLDDRELSEVVAATRPPIVSDQIEGTPACTLLPEPSQAWFGTPGVELTIAGVGDQPRSITRWTLAAGHPRLTHDRPDQTQRIVVEATPSDHPEVARLTIEVELFSSGLVRQRAIIKATSQAPLRVHSLTPTLPVPATATELLHLTGRHLRERHPQRTPFTVGTHLRENRRGRTSLQSATLMAVGTSGFGFGHGQVWAVHVGWSGNQRLLAERMHTDHRTLAGGELLAPDEVVLGIGEKHHSPWVYFSHGRGLDAVAAQHHHFLRTRPGRATRPRPVTLNTWEAVYFDHDLARLTQLAHSAARVGVERFVLDDGWFGSRRDDTSGLGDWTVSPQAWPRGLNPLIEVVRGLGMEFGLWVEPEMVSPDSDLARAHPEWILGPPHRDPITARHQQVLNLAEPGAYAHVRDALGALLDTHDIAYLKWDHNRDLLEPFSRITGGPLVHEQTLAYYRLVDELKAAHPGLEIESCASGGGRVDLGALVRTDRIWTSDCIDPVERVTIQRYTSLLVPPEMMGAHIGAPVAHTTGRASSLPLRVAVAFLGHLGIEWDLTTASGEDLEALGRAITEWKRWRDLLTEATIVHADDPETGRLMSAALSPDRSRALYQVVVTDTSETYPSPRLRLGGLDESRRYHLRVLQPCGSTDRGHIPDWCAEGIELSGAVLQHAGVAAPTLPPGSAVLLVAEAR